ncbi:MAG: WYL domain-containing protein [Bacteroidota bacterium]
MIKTEEIIKKLWNASDDRKACRVVLNSEPFPRVIHPYGVCLTTANRLILVCKQVAGYTRSGGNEGFRNLILDRINEVEILNQEFLVDEDFNPQDSQYKEWIYCLTKNESR